MAVLPAATVCPKTEGALGTHPLLPTEQSLVTPKVPMVYVLPI